MKYAFREIAAIKAADKADPQRIGEWLNKLAGEAGDLTPRVVVEDARNPRSVGHKHFEWDDAVAAEAFRLDQARTLIRAVVIEDEDAETGHSPAYISISDKGGVSYRTLGAVKNSADLQAKVLAQAERDLESWQNRYRSLQDVCAVVREAQRLVSEKRKKQSEPRAQA